MSDRGLWIAFGVMVGGATAMLAFLLWLVGRERDIAPARLRGAILQVFLSVGLAVAAGLAGRALLGTPAFDVGQSTGKPLGLATRPLKGHEMLTIAAAMVAMLLCLVWAVRTVRRVADAPPRPRPPDD